MSEYDEALRVVEIRAKNIAYEKLGDPYIKEYKAIREALTLAAEIERGDKVVVAGRDVLNIKHYINEHPNLGQYFCCGSHECGCQGASHLEYVEHLLEALIEASEAENDHE